MAVSYVPRQYAVPPWSFGKARIIDWRDSTSLSDRDQERIYAAQIQHEVAFQINAALQQHRWTQAEYAQAARMTVQRTGDVLRGEIPMRLEDLGTAHRILGICTTTNPNAQRAGD